MVAIVSTSDSAFNVDTVRLINVCIIIIIITFRTSKAAVQCIVIAPVCLCVCLWVCYHDNSKLRASILTKLGL